MIKTMYNNSNLPPPSPHSKKHAVPSLLDIDPYDEFEFSFPAQTMWWDNSLDFISSDDNEQPANLAARLAQYRPMDLDVLLQKSSPYQIAFEAIPTATTTASPSPQDEETKFIDKIISSISHNAPKLVYKRRRSAMKRRRNRRKRNCIVAEGVHPDFKSLWQHSNVGDLFVQSPSNAPISPPPQLPTVDLTAVNKAMLKRVDVKMLAVKSCSPDPEFYASPPWKNSGYNIEGGAFGHLPGIYTDMGPVALPNTPFYGHVWGDRDWVVKAQLPSDPGGPAQVQDGRQLRDGGRRPREGGQGRRGRVALPS